MLPNIVTCLYTFIRREGDYRLLSKAELEKWSKMLDEMREKVKRIYLLWNTNHEDHSVVNGRNLLEMMGKEKFVAPPPEKGVIKVHYDTS